MATRNRDKEEMKNYELNEKGRKHVFTGKSPRQAALKAATRGFKRIELRERGHRNKDRSYTLHIFEGRVERVPKPDNAPSWLPERVNKPVVRKIETRRVR